MSIIINIKSNSVTNSKSCKYNILKVPHNDKRIDDLHKFLVITRIMNRGGIPNG